MLINSIFNGYFMHHYVQQPQFLCFARTVYLCVPYGSQYKWKLRLCKALTDWSL